MKGHLRNIRFLERGERLGEKARTGVSLHCHTLHSKEALDFVPYYVLRIPIASYFWKRHMARCENGSAGPPDFAKGYWTPPLTGHEVFRSESENLAGLGLDSIVSITDHDSISANLQLGRETELGKSPISMEWTVPFEEGFFHVGIHNLPIDRAATITAELLAYTHSKDRSGRDRLQLLFEMLNEVHDVLIVLNHPIWDIEMIGQTSHELLLRRFVAMHGKWIHAIEINGFRSWVENLAAADLADSLGLPVISGGDRHCLQHNTMVNITNAVTFGEFADEIRNAGHSRIAVMQEYNVALPCRQLRSIAQIMAHYGHFPEGRRAWSDRVHLDNSDGRGLISLTEHGNGRTPNWIYPVFLALFVLAHPATHPLISFMVGDKDIGRNESDASKKPRGESTLGPFNHGCKPGIRAEPS